MTSERKEPDTADTLPATSSPVSSERSPTRTTMPEIAPPFVQRYRLGAELGRGGMGRVVEAFDTQLGRSVALKEVLPRAGVDQRFEREVQITARLEHPSIVPLYDAGTMPDGRPFYVMRRVTGRPLDEVIAKHPDLEGRLSLLPNVLAATDAIAHAHARGILHRDLKPANILVGENGETIVIDWGLAKVIGESDVDAGAQLAMPAVDGLQTVAGAVFGTPGFMAPEQARGDELGPGGDVFALGATLYQLLVGRPPIAGKSATDAIASSIVRRIQPVAQAAPHAPPELVAIVEKALAHEAADRYPNATGLAEDLRRFLTGQLVAAHRYTTRERVARFARKHRAPLSVAALALAAGAVMAWIGVHRIVTERDAANEARGEAEEQREQTLKANAQLIDRADQLLVTRARALVQTSPTEALALLKELRPNSPRIGEARAIATSAVSRGVGWALRSEGDPRHVAVDPEVTHLAVVTRDATLRVWDLTTHRALYDRATPEATPVWIANQRLLLLRETGTEILDPKTGATTKLDLPGSWHGVTTARGDRVAILTTANAIGIYTVATGTWTPVWEGHHVQSFQYAADGSWLALADHEELVVLDATGTVLVERKGDAMLQAVSARHIAAIDNATKRAIEIDLDAGPKVFEYPVAVAAGNFLIQARYRGATLEVATGTFTNHYRDHKLSWTEPTSQVETNAALDIGDGFDVRPASDGGLSYTGNVVVGRISTPAPMSKAMVAGHHGATRFVAVTNGLAMIYDLAEIVPKLIPKRGELEAAFLDDDTLLLWPDDHFARFRVRDLATGSETPIIYDPNVMAHPVSGDASSGRLLVTEPTGPAEQRLLEFEKGKPGVRVFGTGGRIVARAVSKGFMVARDNDPRVLYSPKDAQFVELVKVDGGVQSLMPLANNRFAALGRSGEVVRGALAGGPVERAHVAIDANSFLGTDRDGHAIIVTGRQLLMWDTTVHPITELARAPTVLSLAPNGVIATLDNNAMVYVETAGTIVVHDVVGPASAYPVIAGDGTWVAAPGNGGKITIVEIPSLARWELPDFDPSSNFTVPAPLKRRLLRGVGPNLAVFDFPAPAGDLGAWLDEHTNARENADGFISWPWDKP